jgi:hypothetical protein
LAVVAHALDFEFLHDQTSVYSVNGARRHMREQLTPGVGPGHLRHRFGRAAFRLVQ